MKRSLIFLITVVLIGGGVFLIARKLSKPEEVASPLKAEPEGERKSIPRTEPDMKKIEGKISEGLIAAYCYFVVDGDTIYVKLKDGTKEKIRLVGIDTPEVKHGKRGRDEPGGQEAKKFVMDRCLRKTVFLDIDDESPIDYYGRTLALVYTANTSYKIPRNSLNAILLRKGYAEVLYIPPSEFNPYSW